MESEFENEISLLKQSFHRISKRVLLLEHFLNTKFGEEFKRKGSYIRRNPPTAKVFTDILGNRQRGFSEIIPTPGESKAKESSSDKSLRSLRPRRKTAGKQLWTQLKQLQNHINNEDENLRNNSNRGGCFRLAGLETVGSVSEEIESENDAADPLAVSGSESRVALLKLLDFKSNGHDCEDDNISNANSGTEVVSEENQELHPESPEYFPETIDESDEEYIPVKAPTSKLKNSKEKKSECKRKTRPKEVKVKSLKERKRPVWATMELPLDRKCTICQKQFKENKLWRRKLYVHIQEQHSGEKQYKCDQCEKSFIEKSRLKLHIKFTHNKFEHCKVKCRYCEKPFLTEPEKTKHEMSHNPKDRPVWATMEFPPDRKCTVCHKQFKENKLWRKNLYVHIQEQHSGEKHYKCDQCEKSFFDKHRLKFHIKYTHNKLQHCKVKCRYCEKAFLSVTYRRRHEMSHTGERPASCDVCGSHFTENYKMIAHRVKHFQKKDHLCIQCGSTYASSYNLKLHEKTVHGEVVMDQDGNKVTKIGCHFCAMHFSTKEDRREHIKTIHRKNQPVKKRSRSSDNPNMRKGMGRGGVVAIPIPVQIDVPAQAQSVIQKETLSSDSDALNKDRAPIILKEGENLLFKL